MSENTIFQGSSPSSVSTPPPAQLMQPQAMSGQDPPSPSFSSPPPPVSTDLEEQNQGSSPFKTILKIVIGLIVVVFIGFIFIWVILPKFQSKQGGNVTLTYWGLWEDTNVMRAIINEFEKENSNIKIDYSKQNVKQYREKLASRISNGTGPDIFRFHNSWYPMLSGSLLPLPSDVITKDDFKRTFYPVANKDLVKNGAIYGIPLYVDTIALYINSDLFQAAGATPPTTWEEFITTARALTVKDQSGKIRTAGAALGTFDNVTHAPDIISLLFLQNGVDLDNFNSSSKKASDTLDFYTAFALGDGNVWDNKQDQSVLAFAKGNLAMFFGFSWDYFTIKANNRNLNLKIAPVPQLPGQSKNLASYWVEGVSAKSKHQKEALLFLKFLAKKDTEEKLYLEESRTRDFGEIYARQDLADKLKQAIISPFVSQALAASSSYFADSTFDNGLNARMNEYLGQAVNSILNQTSPETAVETLSKGVTQVLGQYGH